MEGFLNGLARLGGVDTGVVRDELLADETVVQYLAAVGGIGDDAAEETVAVSDLLEVLGGFCPTLAEGLQEVPLEKVEALYAELRAGAGGDGAGSGGTPAAREAQPVTEFTAETAMDKAPEQGGKEEPAPAVELVSGDKNPKLAQLAAVLPAGFDEVAVQYVLERECGNQVEEAAALILDKGMDHACQLYEREVERQRRRAAEQEARELEEQEQIKKSLLGRFDEYAVVEGGPSKSRVAAEKEARKQARRDRKKEAESKHLVRYFEGMVVSRKGERFRPVEAKPAWDGGSKGKVITKGKRGPGFVAG